MWKTVLQIIIERLHLSNININLYRMKNGFKKIRAIYNN